MTKLKKTSIKTYFFERTTGGPKSSTFYPTIKPFLSNKGMKSNNSIIVYENDDFVTKQINKLNIKKAAGYDGISPKIIKEREALRCKIGPTFY